MVIKNVEIKNFRGIVESKIDFKPGFNLIKGENGKGKTSILEAIAVGLGGFIAGFSNVSTRHFSKDEIRRVIKRTGDGSCDEIYQVPTEVSLIAQIHGEECTWTRGRTSVKASRSTIQPRSICKIAEKMSLNSDTELPVLICQGAGRIWSQKREKVDNIFNRKKYSRTVGYTDTLYEASNMKFLLNWCVKMESVSWQKQQKIAEYEAAKRAVSNFMSAMNEGKNYQIFYDRQLQELMCETEQELLTISSLSAGYQSLIWMVFDIAYRMAVLNPDKKDKIASTSGVVLIDEIDMHLHPKWQWNIIDSLRKTFPNVQFIASTHAPILFASAKDVWVIDIENEEYQYDYSHYGIDLNTALRDYQKTDEVPSEVQNKMNQFYDALDEEDFEQAKNILVNLEELTAPEHPLLVQMRTRYEFETMNLEE